MTGSIYTLTCDKTRKIFYVGKTTKTCDNRLINHLSSIRNESSNLGVYMSENRITPIIEEIENLPIPLLNKAEQYWIDQFRQWGFDLLNVQYTPKKAKRGEMKLTLDTELFKEVVLNKRLKDGLMQEEVAIYTFSSKATICRIEKGKLPDANTFINICQWLNMPAETFFMKNPNYAKEA